MNVTTKKRARAIFEKFINNFDAFDVTPDANPIPSLWTLYGLPSGDSFGLVKTNVSLDSCEKWSDSFYACNSSRTRTVFYVHSVFPPVREVKLSHLCVIVIFLTCFIVTICGNTHVLTLLRNITQDRRTRHNAKPLWKTDNTMMYIGALAICDVLMSLSLPPVIIDSLVTYWIFGTMICKLHHVLACIGKILSTFLIAAMSFDRFIAVCFPHQQNLRSRKFVTSLLMCLLGFTFALLMPMLIYASTQEILLHEIMAVNSPNLTRVRVYKCSDQMPNGIFYWFTSSIFLFSYVTPLILIVIFNYSIIKRLYMHKRVVPRSAIPVRRIVWFTVAIAGIYFFCWTPYSFLNLYSMYTTLRGGDGTDTAGETKQRDDVTFLLFCIHCLPYIGSSTNWILYGMLNTQLQKQSSVSRRAGDRESFNTHYRNSSLQKCTSRSWEGETTMRLIADSDQTHL